MTASHFAIINVSKKCCVFETRTTGGDLMYSRKYYVTPSRNIILIPNSVPYHKDAKFIGVRAVLSSDKTT